MAPPAPTAVTARVDPYATRTAQSVRLQPQGDFDVTLVDDDIGDPGTGNLQQTVNAV